MVFNMKGSSPTLPCILPGTAPQGGVKSLIKYSKVMRLHTKAQPERQSPIGVSQMPKGQGCLTIPGLFVTDDIFMIYK